MYSSLAFAVVLLSMNHSHSGHSMHKDAVYSYVETHFQTSQIIQMSMLAVAILTIEWRTERRVLPSGRPGKPTGRRTVAL